MDMVYPDFYFLKCCRIEIEHSHHRDSISLVKINGAVGIDLRSAVALTSRITDTEHIFYFFCSYVYLLII